MKIEDEELQNKMDGGDFSGDGIDAQAYRKVFDLLKREPQYSLPSNFVDRMLSIVDTKRKAREASRDNFWLALGVFFFLVASMVTLALTGFKFSFGAFRFLSGYYGLGIFGIAFVLFLNWLDKKFVRKAQAF